jgi:hypothetical protein
VHHSTHSPTSTAVLECISSAQAAPRSQTCSHLALGRELHAPARTIATIHAARGTPQS